MDLYPLSLLVSLVMGFTRKYLLVNSVTGDVSKVPHQFIGSKWDTDKSSNQYGILVSSVEKSFLGYRVTYMHLYGSTLVTKVFKWILMEGFGSLL